MAEGNGNEKWWWITFRHFSTVMALVAIVWWLALPRIEGFIQSAVNDRISRIEKTLDTQIEQLQGITNKLDTVGEKQDTQIIEDEKERNRN